MKLQFGERFEKRCTETYESSAHTFWRIRSTSACSNANSPRRLTTSGSRPVSDLRLGSVLPWASGRRAMADRKSYQSKCSDPRAQCASLYQQGGLL